MTDNTIISKAMTYEEVRDTIASWSIQGKRLPIVEFIDAQQREIERLRNIIHGCPVCAELERNIRPTHETLPGLSEEAKICIGRSLAELAVLHKDGKTYNIRRVAGQALEVINNLHLMFVRHAQKAGEGRS
jgi:hypothetical protein